MHASRVLTRTHGLGRRYHFEFGNFPLLDRLDVLARTFWAYYCQHGPSRRGSLRSRAFSSFRKTGTQANRPSSHQSKGPMPCRIDPCPLKPPVISTAQHGLRLFISTVGRRGGANRHRVILRGSSPLQFYIRALDAQDFSFDRLILVRY
jgi:hypothetical protein